MQLNTRYPSIYNSSTGSSPGMRGVREERLYRVQRRLPVQGKDEEIYSEEAREEKATLRLILIGNERKGEPRREGGDEGEGIYGLDLKEWTRRTKSCTPGED